MPGSPLRIGVAGAGFGGRVHVPAFRSVPGCRVEAICARTAASARAASRELGVPRALAGWERLVSDPALDAVALALPPDEQEAAAGAALRHGKAVFCEKPVALGAQGARALADLARARSLPNMVDFEFPELETWREARRLLSGPPLAARIVWRRRPRAHGGAHAWKGRPERGGDVWHNFLPHVFHALAWLGSDLRVVAASGGASRARVLLGGRLPAAVDVDLRADERLHEIRLEGPRGERLVLRNPGASLMRGFELWSGGRLLRVEGAGAGGDDRVAPVARLARRFVAWARGGAASGPTFEDGWRAARAVEEARAA